MRLSIIIPIYNVEPYIIRCLQSVAAQTMTDGVECILVDDCGSDRSIQLTDEFVKSYQGEIHFRLLHHEQNQGLSAARNTGIHAARGEYLYFLDSDDEIIPECLEGFFRILDEHPGVDLIQGLFLQDSPYQNQFLTKEIPAYSEDRVYIKQALLDYDQLPVCAANRMVRKTLITDNNIYFREGIIHEDNHWTFFLSKYVQSFAFYRKQCYVYTVNPESITKKVNLQKEIYSSRIIIEDFCANIDPFCRAAQKKVIFYTLSNILSAGYYKNETDKQSLFNLFYSQCTWFEKPILKLWYNQSSGYLKTKLSHLLIRVFR